MYQTFVQEGRFRYTLAAIFILAAVGVSGFIFTSADDGIAVLTLEEMSVVVGAGENCKQCKSARNGSCWGYWDCELGTGCDSSGDCLGSNWATINYGCEYSDWYCNGAPRPKGHRKCLSSFQSGWVKGYNNECDCTTGGTCVVFTQKWWGLAHCNYNGSGTCPGV